MSISVEPLQSDSVAELCLQKVGIRLQSWLIRKEHRMIDPGEAEGERFSSRLIKAVSKSGIERRSFC